MNITPSMDIELPEIRIPDSKLARAITEFIRDTETDLLFNHSSRVYHFGALAGVHRGLKFDRESTNRSALHIASKRSA